MVRRLARSFGFNFQGGWVCGLCDPLDLALYPSSGYVLVPVATQPVAA